MTERARISFDSTILPVDQRFQRYRELYSVGTDAIEIGPHFEARMEGTSLDRSVIYERHLREDVGHERTPARCRRNGMEHFTLTTVVAGEYHVDDSTGFARLLPGESVLLDMTRPSCNRAIDAHVITLAIARDRVSDSTGIDLHDLHGRRINADTGGLLFDHLRSLALRMLSIADELLIPLAGISSTILGLSLGGGKPANRSPHADRLDEIISFIEKNLYDPDFGVDAVLARFALSRATLYRMFQRQRGFALHVRCQRLRRLRQRLCSGANVPPLENLAIDAGFRSEGQASDAFPAVYGVRPASIAGTHARKTSSNGPEGKSRRGRGIWPYRVHDRRRVANPLDLECGLRPVRRPRLGIVPGAELLHPPSIKSSVLLSGWDHKGADRAMNAAVIAAQLAEQFGASGPREALRRYEEACRVVGREAAKPYVAAAIMLCHRR